MKFPAGYLPWYNYLYASMWHGFSYLLGYWKFNSIFIRIGNNLSYSWCCCFVCWKGLWSGWTRTPSGYFWIGHHHGTEPSKGKSLQNENLDKLEHVKENFFLRPFLKLNHLWADLIHVFLGFSWYRYFVLDKLIVVVVQSDEITFMLFILFPYY